MHDHPVDQAADDLEGFRPHRFVVQRVAQGGDLSVAAGCLFGVTLVDLGGRQIGTRRDLRLS